MKEYLVTYMDINNQIQTKSTLAENKEQAEFQITNNYSIGVMYGAVIKNS